jgi:hypothetical protein
LVFAFAALASMLTRDTPASDTILFRRIAKERNFLAHGRGSERLAELPAREAMDLFRRYLALVADAIANNRFGPPD